MAKNYGIDEYRKKSTHATRYKPYSIELSPSKFNHFQTQKTAFQLVNCKQRRRKWKRWSCQWKKQLCTKRKSLRRNESSTKVLGDKKTHAIRFAQIKLRPSKSRVATRVCVGGSCAFLMCSRITNFMPKISRRTTKNVIALLCFKNFSGSKMEWNRKK